MNTKQAFIELEHKRFLQGNKLLSLWSTFITLKSNVVEVNYCPSDSLGGFIHFNQLKGLAKSCKIKPDTLRKKLVQMTKLGWAKRKHTGFVLRSWKKVASEQGFDYKKKFLKGANKTEVNISATELFYRAQKKRLAVGIYKQKTKAHKEVNKTLQQIGKREVYDSWNCGVSTRQTAKAIGLRCNATISRYNKEIVRKKEIIISKPKKLKIGNRKSFDEFISKHPKLFSGCLKMYGKWWYNPRLKITIKDDLWTAKKHS